MSIRKPSVIVICEFSGVVREAFRKRGWNAWSCDLLPTEIPGNHIQENIRKVDVSQFDLAICHPPCRYLAVSGAKWNVDKWITIKGQKVWQDGSERRKKRAKALDFVRYLLDLDVPHIALENPVSIISTKIREPDQIIQPWEFGHGETKKTCFWLKKLPVLRPTYYAVGREERVFNAKIGKNRWKERSRTLPGIAEAFAEQWGGYVEQSLRKSIDKKWVVKPEWESMF